MKEETIATFKHKGNKYSLLQITSIIMNSIGRPTDQTSIAYLIIKNRRIVYRVKSPYIAGKKFAQIIVEDLLQLKFTF